MGNTDLDKLLEHGMTKDTEAPKKATKPKRAKLVNADKANGAIGAEARPLEKDAAKWIAKGWKRAG
jgi:hypothetical protein